MKSGQKLLPFSLFAVASLVAWWAQAGPLARGPLGRLGRSVAPRGTAVLDTPRPAVVVADTNSRYKPSRRPRLRQKDRPGSPFAPGARRSPLTLPLPPSVKLGVSVDDSLKNFNVEEKIGKDIDFRDPSVVSFKEYEAYQRREAVRDYYRQKMRGGVGGAPAKPGTAQANRLIPKIYLGPMADRLFGGSYVDIRPAGSVTLKAGWRQNTNANPALTLRQQSVGDFLFEQNMNLNLTGQIGTKLKLVFNYDTRASFDFENQMKFDFGGKDTDIIQKLDLGNVSLPLTNSLVQGGQNLFGIKTQLQFGRLGVTAVAATVRGSADEVRIQNGAQGRLFEIKASQYERDRHFFLAHFFRERYDQALRNLPTVLSGVAITRLEVYVTNDNRTTDNLRNVVALMDLAEPKRIYRPGFALPSNNPNLLAVLPARNGANAEFGAVLAGGAAARNNNAIDNFLQTGGGSNFPFPPLSRNLDYERIRARKLDAREYSFNAQLGYLSLNTALLPDQVLAVSYQYIYNGQTYTVGETSIDYANVGQDEVIYLKLLKATNPGVGTLPAPRPDPLAPTAAPATRNTPTWDLMMKNIYALNASQLQRDNFQLQVVYKDDATGVDLISLKEGAKIQNKPLIEVLGLDRVNPNNDRNPDGNFDYFPGITIDPELGKVIFPSVEPFGSYLRAQFDTTGTDAVNEKARVRQYVYQSLYSQVQSDAQQQQERDKFFLRGRFQGGAASDEISLPGIGIAQGSVRVRSGSTLLTEGTDYQVFYDLAKVKILNPAYLNSANELRIEFEKNALVQVQPRRLVGTRLDYRVNKDVNIGGTALYMLENQAPGINRVNVGDEPANNGIVGLDGSFRKDSRVLTKYLDKLPFLSTKEISTIAFSGEFAKLLPGRSQLGRGENGVSYLDDFENARTPYTLGGLAAIPSWRLAATPSTIATANTPATSLGINNRRARLAWYTVDQTYYTGASLRPGNIEAGDLLNHYTRGIQRDEVFPNKDLGATGNGFEFAFDLAYFPGERGPYNYNPAVTADGRKFTDGRPEDKFGGISRAITFDTDFDNANVEYLEFWMMDPFIQSGTGKANITDTDGNDAPNRTGGELIINLGNVSEDALRDANQYEFENGLPATTDPQDIDDNSAPTVWGRVSRQQFLTDAFSAAPGARALQDVGLDGIGDAAERAKATAATNPYPASYATLPDPSNDNFRHHLDPSYDAANAKILARYKNYNGYDGNSQENNRLSSTPFPDKEDLNRDNVVQDVERYYEYRLPIKPGTDPTEPLTVGQNYVIDKVTTPPINGDVVNWYLFRIPVREPTRRVENGQTTSADFGFKNIRFLRMYMTGWAEPVVLRLVQPQFVANQWRRYNSRIADGLRLGGNVRTDADAFSISTVSIEENGLGPGLAAGAVPYLTPPGIQRDREYGSTSTSRVQNEQSLRLCVTNLRDGYAKSAYKNLSTNLLRYKRLRLFLHADSDDPTVRDNDVQGFVRIGTDYTQNYYEYRRPLKITRNADLVGRGEEDQRRAVWPDENQVDVAFQDFIDAKSERNKQSPVNLITPFTKVLPNGATITVVGNPDFSAVQGCMIGILNPTNNDQPVGEGNKSVCLWADEFRVFDFESDAGLAATARLSVKLADVANITATGSYTTIGFGGLQDKAQQRAVDNTFRGDVSATIAADKFLPPVLNLRVPMLVQYGREIRTPKYDPLDPDTKLTQSLEKFQDDAGQRDAYRNKVITQTTTRTIALLNVRKERGPAPGAAPPALAPGAAPAKARTPKPWDVENVALSYSLAERWHSDIRTLRDYTRTYTAAVAYTYQLTPKNFAPLEKVKLLDNPYLKILQGINFTPLPSRFSFRTDIDRRYNERFFQRVANPGEVPSEVFPRVYQKAFFISRIYDLRWDLTKALIFDYTATNRGVIDEGPGPSLGDSDEAVRNREQLKTNLLRGGRTTNFNQRAALTYRLPLDKFPLTDWLSADARYAASYTWQAASTALRAPINPVPQNDADTATAPLRLGNTIQNNAELTANGKIDLVKLYNKVKFLNIINNAQPAVGRVAAPRDEAQAASASESRPKPAVKDTARKDPLRFVKAILRGVMTARSLNFTYTRTNGTLLPGYLPKTKLFGFADGFTSPGLPFVLGQQQNLDDLYQTASSRGWYTDQSQYLNTPLSSLFTDNLNLRTALEPFRDFNVQVDARRQSTFSREVFYRKAIDTLLATGRTYDDGRLAPRQSLGSGSFSTSTITIQTLFGDLSDNGNKSRAFERFVQNREFVQQKLTAANPNTVGTYGYNSQDVLIQSFTDAYHGRSSSGYEARAYNPLRQIPLPNWRVDYAGFAQLNFVKRYFSSFTLNHAYSSVYNVGSFITANNYAADPGDRLPFLTNSTRQFLPYYVVGQVSIVEALSPLVGINFQTTNRVTGRAEYRTNRTLALNATNAQVTELYTNELVIGFGYATNSLKLPFRIGGEQRVLKNNLTARLDLSIRDNITVQRSILGVVDINSTSPGAVPSIGRASSQITNGAKQLQLRPTIDYLLNARLNLQLYYSQTITTPRVGNAFRNATTEGGIQLRYSLTQ